MRNYTRASIHRVGVQRTKLTYRRPRVGYSTWYSIIGYSVGYYWLYKTA